MRRREWIQPLSRFGSEGFFVCLQCGDADIPQRLKRLPAALKFLQPIRRCLKFAAPSINYDDISASAKSCTASEPLYQAGPWGQLGDKATRREIDAGFNNLRRDDDAICTACA